jgi:hypothetical protein
MTIVEAYGLAIQSEIPLPEAPASGNETQVVIRLGKVEKPPGDPNAERTYQIDQKNFRVYWRGVGTFLICCGSDVLVEPEPGAEEAILRLYLLGPVLGILLHQRGLLVLHASVVSIAGSAVGFLGEKGWGKSTTAAALNARGHGLVADDILAVLPGNNGKPMVQPGLPHFKLWPEAVTASFGDDANQLVRLHSKADKRIRQASVGVKQSPIPLSRLYVLDQGEALESVVTSPSVALLALIRHSYLAHLMPSLHGVQTNFVQCARLAQQVQVQRLLRPKNLFALGEIVRLVESEANSDKQTALAEVANCHLCTPVLGRNGPARI